MTDLPPGWALTKIIEVVELQANGNPFQQGWSPQCESRPAAEDEWGVLKTTAIQHGEFWAHENKALPDELSPKPQIEVRQGDVLMTCAGPRNRCGVACLVQSTRTKLMMSGKMYRFRPHPEALDAKFLSNFIRLHETQLRIDAMKTGISDSGLNLTHGRFGELPIIVPPLNEQCRIVEKIEALFDEIDKGVESLAAAKAALGLYRQSLLKSAFEGRLTADWRAQSPDKLEDPQTLLARIRDEPKARYKVDLDAWQDALTQWRSNGEKGRKPTKPKRPKDFFGAAKIPSGVKIFVPSEWLTLPMSDLGQTTGGLTKNQKRNAFPLKAKYLRVANVYSNRLELDEITEIGVTEEELFKTSLVTGDLLFVEGNGSIEQIGRVAIWDGSIPNMTHQNHLIRFGTGGMLSSRFALYFMTSPVGRKLIEAQASSTSGLHTLSISKIEGLPVPICSPAEQAKIVRILDARLDAADRLATEIDTALSRANALRQSILKRAFSGQLVPQDPTDEPASALLARIQQERAATSKKGKRKVSA